MKRFWYLQAGLLFIAVLLFTTKVLASTNDFEITSFSADYFISRDQNKYSQMTVNETIDAVFPDYDQNHGILRSLPKSYLGLSLHLKINSVIDENGQAYHYTSSTRSGNLVLKIGDANRYVHGHRTYKINYSLRNVIAFYDDNQFYWDINGDQWPQEFGSVNSRLHVPNDLADSLDGQLKCFNGSFGQSQENCTIVRNDLNNESVISSSASPVNSYSTLTNVVGFKSGTFLPNKRDQRLKQLRPFIIAGSIILLPIATSIFMIAKWRRYGRDPKGRGVIVPEYSPPKDLTVLDCDVILNEKLRNNAISAEIVNLATAGYIKIYELKKKGLFGKSDYELELVQDGSNLSTELQSVLNMLFSAVGDQGAKVKVSELKNSLYSEARALGKAVPERLFKAGYFSNNPIKAGNRYRVWGGILIVLGFILFTSAALGLVVAALGVSILLSGVIIIGWSNAMSARSALGVEVHDYLLGLKEYMQLAEADRIKFLQSPKGVRQYGDPAKPKNQIKLFEALLPYAMLFGIEKDWAKQFKDLYKNPPDWYSGNVGTFNAVYLASSLNNFSNASAASFSPPSSSSSSGFGGGGFSGGGGGGGGGGGW